MKSALVLGLLVLLAGPAISAEPYADPTALVSAIYQGYQPGAAVFEPTEFYSERLKGIANLAAETDVLMSGSADTLETVAPFNPFVPDKQVLLFDLFISAPTILDGRAIVTVTYHNFDQPRLLALSLVAEDGGWKVDDVASMGSDVPWLLSWALAADPYGF